jgi:hypothetical protein
MRLRAFVLTLLSIFVPATSLVAREWTDATGKFRVEAELVVVKNGKVYLEKADGTAVSVPVDRLSDADRKYLSSISEKQGTAEKQGTGAPTSASKTRADDSPAQVETAANAAELPLLARRAHEILEATCYRCHGKDGATEGGFNFVLNFEKLAKTHVKPKDAPGSLLYQRISAHDHDTIMPPEREEPRPSQNDVAAIRQWIQAGAPAISDEKPREFITNDDVFKAILGDLRSTPERSRKYNRYFTLTHLYNAGISEDELQTYRLAFVKLINSLSWNADLISPTAVDSAATVLRVDIRLLNWNDQIWNEIVKHNPYGLKIAGADATACYHESKTEMPAVRVDWFVFAASRPPLYHAILALPESAGGLEQMLHVNVAADIEQEQVIRAAFNRSGVSRNNRLIERHKLPQGSYWKSYDFAGNTGRKNLFEHPMGPGDAEETFRHDGGEIIFSLPNGLQGYMLVNGSGQRIDRGPTEIVSDAKRSDRAVMNGISCMSCHYAGMITKSDEIRPFIEANRKAFSDVDSVLALYPKQQDLDSSYDQDGKRFTSALGKIGMKIVSRTGEPVSTMAARFEDELDLRLAAAEFGFRPDELVKKLDKSDSVARALGALRISGGTVKRDSFVEVFSVAAREFGLEATPATPTIANVSPPRNPTRPAPGSSNNGSMSSGATATRGNWPAGGSARAAMPRGSSPRSNPVLIPNITNPASGKGPTPGEYRRFGEMGWGVTSLVFSPDGKKLAVGKMDRALLLFNVETGAKIDSKEGLQSLGEITSLTFTADGKKLLSGSSSGEIDIWDVKPTGQLSKSGQFAGHTGAVRTIAVSRDGRTVLSSGGDKRCRYWQLDSGREVIAAVAFSRDVMACHISPDGIDGLASDGETFLRFDLSSGETKATFKTGLGHAMSVAMSASADGQLACCDGSTLRFWDLKTGAEAPNRIDSREIQWGMTFSPDGKLLFSGGAGRVNVWDVAKQERIASLETAGTSYIKTIAVSVDGRFIATIPYSAGQILQVIHAPKR